MILTNIPEDELPHAVATFAGWLESRPLAKAVFDRIVATQSLISCGVDLPEHRAAAVSLAHQLGIPTLDEEPAVALSWDGKVLRTRSEAWVILHEIAHWQLSPPSRRHLPDFGVGAGPESGLREIADAVQVLSAEECQRDEALASLLGILWEIELNQPAVLAFLEQNWMEGYERASAANHFISILEELHVHGLVDDDGRPLYGSVSERTSVALSL